jgi:predicted dehydrogenase
MSKIKCGVVGVGSLGRHHLRWLSQLPEAEVVGIYDIDAAKAAKYSKEYKIKAFGSLEELADNVEAATIVVPTTAHFQTATKLISKNVHCLIEKPVTVSVDEANQLRALADQAKVKITVGQIERFNPAVSAIKDFNIKPSFIEAHRLAAFDPRGTDVAVVLDLMIHDIDLTLYLVGSRVIDIQASAVAVISEQADIANARLTFANGAVANLTASRISLNAMRKLRIFQQSGYFSLDLAAKKADVYRLAVPGEESKGMRVPLGKSGRDLIYNKVGDADQDMLGAELQSFLQAIANDSDVAVSVEQAAEALRIAVEIDRIGRANIDRMLEGEPA